MEIYYEQSASRRFPSCLPLFEWHKNHKKIRGYLLEKSSSPFADQ
jgi:hypothetical protein